MTHLRPAAMSHEMEDEIIQSDDTFLSARLDALVRDRRLKFGAAPPAICT
jgi:hypothetical protein